MVTIKTWRRAAALAATMLGLISARAWSQHGGHAMSAPSSISADDARSHFKRLEKIQRKIDNIDRKLEGKNLLTKKRAKLEKKLDKLLKEKGKLLDGH